MFKFQKYVFILIFIFFTCIPSNVFAKYSFSEEFVCNFQIETIEEDLQFDNITFSVSEITEEGTTFKVEAIDNNSGIARIELYINDNIYANFTYDTKINSATETIKVKTSEIPFYSDCYVAGVDNSGNTLNSNIIIPNTSMISDLEDLLKFREYQNNKIVDFKEKDIYLLNDIDLLNQSWIPISSEDNPFEGNFHGNFHKISNMNIEVNSNCQGFFGKNNGNITKLIVSGTINSNSYENVGGIAGINCGAITYSNSEVTISENSNKVGGIVGSCINGDIEYCKNYNSITGNSYIGGICGYSQNSYFRCLRKLY